MQTLRTTWRDQGPFVGAKMVLLVSLTRTVSRTSPLLSGTEKSTSLLAAQFNCTNSDSDFLKERLFGLSNPQGNHGESLKEAHFHLDNTPTVRITLQLCYKADKMSAFVHEISL